MCVETRQQRSFYKYHARPSLALHQSKDPATKDFSSLFLSRLSVSPLLTTLSSVSLSLSSPRDQHIKQAHTHTHTQKRTKRTPRKEQERQQAGHQSAIAADLLLSKISWLDGLLLRPRVQPHFCSHRLVRPLRSPAEG